MLKQLREYRVYFKLGITSNLRGVFGQTFLVLNSIFYSLRKCRKFREKRKSTFIIVCLRQAMNNLLIKHGGKQFVCFETNKLFIKREDANWKSINKLEKEMFIKAPPPAPGKSRIGHCQA